MGFSISSLQITFVGHLRKHSTILALVANRLRSGCPSDHVSSSHHLLCHGKTFSFHAGVLQTSPLARFFYSPFTTAILKYGRAQRSHIPTSLTAFHPVS